MKVGDLVRIRMARAIDAPNMYIGVVVDYDYAAPGGGDLVKVSFLNPPYYKTAYYDPTDGNWYKPKSLEVLSESR